MRMGFEKGDRNTLEELEKYTKLTHQIYVMSRQLMKRQAKKKDCHKENNQEIPKKVGHPVGK